MPKRKQKKGVDDLLRGVGETLGIIERKPAVAKPAQLPTSLLTLRDGPSTTSYKRHQSRRASQRRRASR